MIFCDEVSNQIAVGPFLCGYMQLLLSCSVNLVSLISINNRTYYMYTYYEK